MADYQNYDAISWSLGTPITHGRLQQMSTNISEVKTASGNHAKGVIVLNQFTSQISTIANGVLHTGLAGSTYTISTLNSASGSGSTDQRITLEAARYYKVVLSLPNIYLSGGHAGSHFVLSMIKTVSSVDTTLGTFNIMRTNAPGAAYFGGGVYHVMLDTGAGSTTPHEISATLSQANRGGTDTDTYSVSISTNAPLQLWVEDAGASA